MVGMVDSRLSSYARLLDDVVGIFGVLVDPRVVPAADSPAAGELRAAAIEPAEKGFWGDRPVRTSYALAAMSYQAALEQASAMAALMTGGFTVVPAAGLARCLTETASQAWWLLEPPIGHRRRVERLQATRARSATEGQRVAAANGVADHEQHRYTETIDQLAAYSQSLQLDTPHRDGHVWVCGAERLPSPSRRVEAMFTEIDVPAVYGLYSAFTHGELFALWQGYENHTDGGNEDFHRATINVESFKGVVSTACWALTAVARRAVELFGLDRNNVDHAIDKHDATLFPE